MAIHDDQWTKEMPAMYTYSWKERAQAALLLTLMAGAVLIMAFPQYTPIFLGLAASILIPFCLMTIYYLIKVVFLGR